MTNDTNTEERVCPTCEGTFTVQVPAPGRPRQYCTARCRSRASSRARRLRTVRLTTLAQESLSDPAKDLQPCGWCGLHVPGKDYCTLACEVLHQRMLQLQAKLRGLRPGMPIPGLDAKFADLERMRATRRQLRQENRERYLSEARTKVDEQQRKAQDSEVRRLSRELARARLQAEQLRKADRVARRQAKKGN